MSTKKDRGSERIRALEIFLSQSISQQEEIDALNELAWELRMSRPGQAQTLSQKAYELGQSGEFSTLLYTQGLAYSLINQAFVDSEAGGLDTAASKCLEALALLENEEPTQAVINAWYTLGWNSFYLGDYPAAMEYGLKALKLSRELGSRLHEGWALDAIASFYVSSEEFPHAMQLYEEALRIFRSLNEVQGELRALNNMATALYERGQYSSALEAGYLSLQLTRQYELNMEAINVCCTIAQILVDMGQLDQAEVYLRESLSGIEVQGPNVTHVYVLEEWGRFCLAKNDLQGAETSLEQALELAVKLDRRVEQARCHEDLSKVYERQSHFPKALEHYRKFHSLNEVTTGEQVTKRLAVLNVTHQVESAQREAEIHRLQNIELQREIEERKHIQDILELLATLDPLTNLYNRRHFMDLAQREFKRAVRYHHALTALLLDFDHFKQINDQFGHAGGDEVLVAATTHIRSVLRQVDIIGRYGGEEFVAILPETPSAGGLLAGERIRQEIAAQPIKTEVGLISVTVSIGIASIPKEDQVHPITLETLLKQADEALYVAKRAGRNRTCIF